jgi:type I restriction enzyme S subunit
MGKWPEVTLGSLAAPNDGAIAIGPFGSAMKAETYTPFGVPVIRGTNISGNRAWKGDWVFISQEFADSMPRCAVTNGTLVFPHRGSIGEVAIVPKDDHARYFLSTSLMKIEIDETKANPLFVYFFFRSHAGRSEILKYASQVGTPGIGQPLSSLKKFKLPLPPLATQNAIASILGALDDKIDLNRRMNQTLEAMARAIFKDWFVEFGPTRAKIEGRGPYLAPEIWSLFPDRLDEEGKPEGWNEKPLDQIAEFLNGLALQKYPANEGPYLPVIKIAELRAGNSEGSDKASTKIPSAYVVQDGDVLFSWSGSLLNRVWTAGQGALNQHLFKVTSTEYPKWFFFHWIGHHLPDFQAIAASKATTMGHIQRHHLTQAKTIVPDRNVMTVASEIIGPLFERGIKNDLETSTLAAMRDLLLPKLMSGEIRVKDVAKIAEAAL